MHEFSIAINIIDIIRQHISQDDLPNVRLIHLRIGTWAGVVPSSLEFCFTSLKDKTELHEASLKIEQTPFVIRCNSCGQESESEFGVMVCEYCESTDTHVVSGTEMEIKEIEVNESVLEGAWA